MSLPPFPLLHLLFLANITLCRAAHLLQVDFVDMHGKCTVRYLRGVPYVRDMCDKSYPGPVCKTFFKMDQAWCCFCALVYHPPLPPLPLFSPPLSLSSPSALPLLSPSSPPPNSLLSLLISLFILFFSSPL